MSRVIKFRAWHNKAKQMLMPEKTSHLFQWIEEGQDIEVMQYIGLKGVNDVEIYVDDIVKYNGAFGSIIHTWYGGYSVGIEDTFVVCSLKSGFCLVKTSLYIDQGVEIIPSLVGVVPNYSTWNVARGLEVIGNIHQNPDLIK